MKDLEGLPSKSLFLTTLNTRDNETDHKTWSNTSRRPQRGWSHLGGRPFCPGHITPTPASSGQRSRERSQKTRQAWAPPKPYERGRRSTPKTPEGPQGAERCPTPGALSESWRPEAACTRDYVCSAARPLRPGPMPRGTGVRLTEAAGGPGPLACSGGLRAGGGRSSSGWGRDERRRLRWPHADTPVPPDDSPSLPQTGTASPYCSATGASDQVPHK